MAEQKRYKIEQVVKIFTDAGPNPTTKAGNEAAKSVVGNTFLTTKEMNGWLAMDDNENRWIQKSACVEIDVIISPPTEPQPRIYQWRHQRLGQDGQPMVDSQGVPVMEDWHEAYYYE